MFLLVIKKGKKPAGQNIDVVSDIEDLISFCLNALLTFFFFLGQTNILFQLNRKEN